MCLRHTCSSRGRHCSRVGCKCRQCRLPSDANSPFCVLVSRSRSRLCSRASVLRCRCGRCSRMGCGCWRHRRRGPSRAGARPGRPSKQVRPHDVDIEYPPCMLCPDSHSPPPSCRAQHEVRSLSSLKIWNAIFVQTVAAKESSRFIVFEKLGNRKFPLVLVAVLKAQRAAP